MNKKSVFILMIFLIISILTINTVAADCTAGEFTCSTYRTIVKCVTPPSYGVWETYDTCDSDQRCRVGSSTCEDLPTQPLEPPEPEPGKTEPYCFSNGCTAGDYYGEYCYVNHYWCQDVKPSGYGCQDELIERAVKTAKYSEDCGTEQIDIYCPAR